MIKPPKECPMKEILERHWIGQKAWMYYFTSLANLSPISKISPSVRSSFAWLLRNIASGCARLRLFFKRRMSMELPWKPWHSTNRCTPIGVFGCYFASKASI
jgi:hypothetical protein